MCDANVLNFLDVLDVLDVVNVLKDASIDAGVLLQPAAIIPHMRYVEGAEDRHHVLLEAFYVTFFIW